MSYNFAVWDGPAPLSNAHAFSEFERRIETLQPGVPPTSAITRLVKALLQVYPDSNTPGGEESPWTDGPLISNASGDMIYFGVAEDAIEVPEQLITELSAELTLVAFDPQQATLMPSALQANRTTEFELPAAHELSVHLSALIGEALSAGVRFVGIAEEVETSSYVQWMTDEQGGLEIEVQGEAFQPPQRRLSPGGKDEMRQLGFEESDPNWCMYFEHGNQSAATASQLLAHSLCEVRKMAVGTMMQIETFPA